MNWVSLIFPPSLRRRGYRGGYDAPYPVFTRFLICTGPCPAPNCLLTPLTASKIIGFSQLSLFQGEFRYEFGFSWIGANLGRRRDSSFLFPRPIERTDPEITRTRKHDTAIHRVGADATRPGRGLRWQRRAQHSLKYFT